MKGSVDFSKGMLVFSCATSSITQLYEEYTLDLKGDGNKACLRFDGFTSVASTLF